MARYTLHTHTIRVPCDTYRSIAHTPPAIILIYLIFIVWMFTGLLRVDTVCDGHEAACKLRLQFNITHANVKIDIRLMPLNGRTTYLGNIATVSWHTHTHARACKQSHKIASTEEQKRTGIERREEMKKMPFHTDSSEEINRQQWKSRGGNFWLLTGFCDRGLVFVEITWLGMRLVCCVVWHRRVHTPLFCYPDAENKQKKCHAPREGALDGESGMPIGLDGTSL